MGEGEWAAAKYGGRGRRGWKKLHLGVDRSGVIVAEVLTDGDANDAKTALALIDNVEGDIETLTADAAYDTLAIYDASTARGIEVVVDVHEPDFSLQRVRQGVERLDRGVCVTAVGVVDDDVRPAEPVDVRLLEYRIGRPPECSIAVADEKTDGRNRVLREAALHVETGDGRRGPRFKNSHVEVVFQRPRCGGGRLVHGGSQSFPETVRDGPARVNPRSRVGRRRAGSGIGVRETERPGPCGERRSISSVIFPANIMAGS